QKAGFGFDEMWILVTTSDGFHFDLVATDFLSERSEVGSGSHDIQLARGARRGRASRAEQRQRGNKSDAPSKKSCVSHVFSENHNQNGCAPCAPITKRNWNRISF